VWDHLPSADELLDARVAAGWQPTPTATRDGEVILGHAACLLARPPAAEPPAR
jgi:hypothetical protein